jgi:hypothetical protein
MAEWEVVQEKPHSQWGASQAHKRRNCLGSLRMESNAPKEESEYAKEGTKAHGVCEAMVKAAIMDGWKRYGTRRAVERAYFFNRHQDRIVEATAMMDAAEEYVGYIRRLMEENPGAKILLLKVEHGFDMSWLRPDFYGTCDCILIVEYVDNETGEIIVEMHVIDFKYGQGVIVGARENDQLAYYALGAHNDFYLLYGVTKITLHVVQPRVKNFDSWSTTPEWLTGKFRDGLCADYDASQEKEAPLTPGSWCHESFCRARGFCPALVKKAIDVTKEYGNIPLVRQVWASDALAMEMIGVVRAWATAREAEIKRKILNHEKTDATAYFKVVNGRSSRTWDNPAKLAQDYPVETHPLLWHAPEFKSVAQIENAIKHDDLTGFYDFELDFKKHVVKTPGAPTITRITDSRVAIDKTDQAFNEFQLEDMRKQTEQDETPTDPLIDLLG